MTGIALVLILAVTVEALVEYGKSLLHMAVKDGWKTAALQLTAVAVSVALCLLTGADLFASFGIAFGHTAGGRVLTGVLSARGANYLADFLKRLEFVRTAERE